MDTKELFEELRSGSIIDESVSVLIVAAHPDDETIGAGSLFNRILNLSFLHTTNGAPGNEIIKTPEGLISSTEYSLQRFKEFYEALKVVSCRPRYHVKMGFKDQQTSFQLSQLTMRMMETLRNLRPDFIFVHPFEGGHPDHDAAAFAVHNAAVILRTEGHDLSLIEYTSYFNNNGLMQTGEFLSPLSPVYKLDMDEEQARIKKKMFDCFVSQSEVLKYFPLTSEKFREAPKYDFLSKPSSGKMYYDLFNWGIDSHTWFRNARIASNEISFIKRYIHDNS